MEFYLPNFEDMVDPGYDFLTDQPSPGRRDRWAFDRFAHEFFTEPIFDGMLVSKASLSSTVEERVRRAGANCLYHANGARMRRATLGSARRIA